MSTAMDLNVAMPELNLEENDMIQFPLLSRDSLKILASPGSESSGVSSLDADEAKKLGNEQLPSSPTLASEPSSAVQTESESSDGGSDGDDEKLIDQTLTESVKSTDSKDLSLDSDSSDDDNDDEKDNVSEKNIEQSDTVSPDAAENTTELVSKAAAEEIDQAAIELDEIKYKKLKIMHGGRDILDFSANVANKSWDVQYAHLPEKNYQMYINNRSQYNRLASGYESPDYSLSTCAKCMFHYPVIADEKGEQKPVSTGKTSVLELLTSTLSTIVSRDSTMVNRESPIQNLNALAQKLTTPSMASPMHAPNSQTFNFLLNNNANATSAPSYSYQNRNHYSNGAANNANHNCFKPNNNSNNNNSSNNSNAFYGNNVMLNALVNQMSSNINNSSAFNSNFMNTINGTNNSNQMNQLNSASLNNLMNPNRQLYGMCRQNINKSGINFNANSHKQMPTYSHF